ncbi:TPA: HAD-IIB family hydrolase [Streptococcus pneumoniae]
MNEKVFRDPVHNYIHVNNQIIYDLINTKEFQRLRRIKQLGTSSYTFHGGEHSRFSHCLGVYEIARRITEIFEEKYPEEWNPAESLLTMTAALLHDLGHGAYSHTFENLFDTDHEAITQEIIQNPETEIHQVLLQVAPDFPEKVASVIDHTYPNKQVVQLISSQIDADRMDYLLRDSYFTGASYGEFDLTRILRVIRPIENGIATANRNIGTYTVHESTLVSMPIFYRTPEEMAGKEIVKCMFIDEPEILDAAIEKIPAEFYEHYSINKSAPFYLELLKKNVDKGSAITHLAEKLGLTKDETMAIGDEENDRAMLEVVGNPVVMENGNPEIKKIAKYTTKTNDESGVAHAIRTWVL